ncbi:MAG: prepilin-type N-terminal cleavage/methylation domain-containing protein [Parcubacteria group bacterium]|nr:prepilin-type N-terminal cleavage/methylation domain-containing protein [Parcubacteria group bacterium]
MNKKINPAPSRGILDITEKIVLNHLSISSLRGALGRRGVNNYGFTLIELLVSIFIVALLGGFFMVNYHDTNKRSELGMVKQKLASDIRLAQNYSLGAKTYDGLNTPGGGWGVHFDLADPTHYIIFADQEDPNGNQVYEDTEKIETKTLPVGITLDSLSPANTVDIVFFPPDPVTYVNSSAVTNAQITLRENINNSTAVITVNSFGLIDTD